MSKLSYILFFFLLMGCHSTEIRDSESGGYLLIEGVLLKVDAEIIPLTRAVNAGLQIQIWRNGALVEGQDYAPGADLSKRIKLQAGEGYKIKAFTPDQTEAANNDAGHPVYNVESEAFSVVEADITTISLVAPQINVGVGIQCGTSFLENFTDISVTITSESGRSIIISGSEDTALRYFNMPASGKLQYTVKATNADGEPMEQISELEVGTKNYVIKLSI